MNKNITTALLLVLGSSLLISCTTINNPPPPPPMVMCVGDLDPDCERLEPMNEVASVCPFKPSCEEPDPTNKLACVQTHIPKATVCQNGPESKPVHDPKCKGVSCVCLFIILAGLLLSLIMWLFLKGKKEDKPQSPMFPATGMSEEIQELVKFIQKTTAQLKTAEKLIDPLRANLELHYKEAGNWARHFSTVRMTVMTFTITTCVALIAWKWQAAFDNEHKADDLIQLVLPVGVLWLTGVITFWLFTCHTYSQIRRQQVKRPHLPAKRTENYSEPKPVPMDGASWVVPVLTWVFLYYFIPAAPDLGAIWKTIVYAFEMFSTLFPLGLWCWLAGRKGWFVALIILFVFTSLVIFACYDHGSFVCHHFH